MNKLNYSLLIIIALVLYVGVGETAAQQQTDIKTKRITIQAFEKPIFVVFGRLIYRYDIPIGFEESDLDSSHDDYHFETNAPPNEWMKQFGGDKELRSGLPPVSDHLITVDFKDASLEEVMNAIVAQMKFYRWEVIDGVVNITPIKGRSPKFEELLDLRVHDFICNKGTEFGSISFIIFGLPEVETYLRKNLLFVDNTQIAPWFADARLLDSLHFSDVSLRNVLNNVTKTKRGGWIVQRNKHHQEKNKEFIDILV